MKRICIYILLITLSSTNLKAQFPADTAYYMTNIYKLGEVVVSNSANKEVVNLRDMQKHNHTDVAVAIGILPSVSFNHAGARNEGTIYLRGFDLRSVPVFADGIPIYVPYDGYVDLARFSNSDLSKIEISKGASSVLYGANNIGGTINLVSSKPTHRFELLLRLGALSGNAYTTHVSLGSKIGKFYIQGNFTKLDKEYMVLSHDFDTTKNETDWERDNSYRNDNKASFKIAFTPNQTDEYSVNYINQYSEKGNPVYLGADPTIKLRYWQWPQWDK